ncbi:hypothetical protein [Massilia brevitalea]|uniref:hypothetical protein n=1 Tax=Massilia brevitalea TaxID=442526 RepID=UPI002738217A|nr:hypothetical protein [Massilia brevitalea]
MVSRLRIQILLEDDDGMLTIDSHVAGGGFSGLTQVYTTYEALEQWANELAALALTAGETVAFQAGARDSYAWLSIAFTVVDTLGHCTCRVALESNSAHTWPGKNKLEVDIQVEPHAIDRFVAELRTLAGTREPGDACLRGADNC